MRAFLSSVLIAACLASPVQAADNPHAADVGDANWAAVKAHNPKARRVVADSRKQFVEFIQNSPKPVEERFYNVRIDTNGAVGSVYFDFDFLQDGKVTNRGSETWQMVRGEDGWKIGAMLYSMGK